MKRLRVGIIGIGGIGKSHIKNYKTHPAVDVVSIADVHSEHLNQIKQDYNIPGAYNDYKEMLAKEQLDMVSVCTPNFLHMRATIDALNAGAHVLCEKPMAMNANEALKMIDCSRKTGKRIMINFSYRFKPESLSMKQLVDSSLLGNIYFAHTRWLRRKGMPGFGGWFGIKEFSGGGPLIDLGVHRLDLALWLMGYPKPLYVIGNSGCHIASECASKEGKKFDVEDFASGFIQFENGATLSIEASWATHIKEKENMETRLLGVKGGIHQYNTNEGYTFETEAYYEKEGFQYNLKLNGNQESVSPMYHFADAVLNEKPHMATAEEGLTVMRILDAIYESAQTKKPVTIGG